MFLVRFEKFDWVMDNDNNIRTYSFLCVKQELFLSAAYAVAENSDTAWKASVAAKGRLNGSPTKIWDGIVYL